MKECQCKDCKGACRNKPGWFLPGEIEKTAAYLGITVDELFSTKLAVDYWLSDKPGGKNIFVISPATKTNPTGEEFPFNPKGECIFFDGDLCEIHQAKPFECSDSMCTDEPNNRHKNIAFAWKKNQQQIKKLLGRDPVASFGSILDMLIGIADWYN